MQYFLSLFTLGSGLVYHDVDGGCLELQDVKMDELLSLDTAVGILGLLLLLFGDRLYRLMVMAPGFFIGGYVATHHINIAPESQLFATVLCSIIGGFVMLLVEKFTVALFGALLGGALTVSLADLIGGVLSTEWYWPVIGALLGSFLFPPLFKKNLALVTAGIGSLCLAHSLEREQDTVFIVGVGLFGWLFQTLLRRRREND